MAACHAVTVLRLLGTARRHVSLILGLVLAFSVTLPALAQQTLLVRQVSLISPARPGTDATIVVATTPNAACTITVIYKSGPSHAKGLVPKSVDAQGRVTWTWRVGPRTVADRAGHKDVGYLIERYAHAIVAAQDWAASIADNLLPKTGAIST